MNKEGFLSIAKNLNLQIIPAIDLLGGQVVRLYKGDYQNAKIYSTEPKEIAKKLKSMALSRIHVVDLDGAKQGKITNWSALTEILSVSGLIVEFSGGIRKTSEIKKLFDLGVAKIGIGSLAVKNVALVKSWITQFGQEKFVLTFDCQNSFVKTNGWLKSENLTLLQAIKNYHEFKNLEIMATDIDCDGTLNGPNLSLYKDLVSNFPNYKIIASGGVSSEKDLLQLDKIGVFGAIVGKMLYEFQII